MSETTNPNLKLIAIRGATTAKGNTDSFIKEVVIELIQELITLIKLDILRPFFN